MSYYTTNVRVYYAHCKAIYNTPQEKRDLDTLLRMGYTVVDPNSPEIQDNINNPEFFKGYSDDKDKPDAMKYFKDIPDAMKYFLDLVDTCDVLAFRALPNGQIPAGVALEVQAAIQNGMIVFELPSGIQSRIITVAETREYLKEIGQR